MSLFAAPTWFTIVPNGLFPVVTVTARFYNHTIPIVGECWGWTRRCVPSTAKPAAG